MEEDEDEQAAAGPSSAAGAAKTVQAGPLSVAQKTTMGLVLRDIFFKKDGGCHSVKLAQLVEEYNRRASKPASAEHIDQAITAHLPLQVLALSGMPCNSRPPFVQGGCKQPRKGGLPATFHTAGCVITLLRALQIGYLIEHLNTWLLSSNQDATCVQIVMYIV